MLSSIEAFIICHNHKPGSCMTKFTCDLLVQVPCIFHPHGKMCMAWLDILPDPILYLFVPDKDYSRKTKAVYRVLLLYNWRFSGKPLSDRTFLAFCHSFLQVKPFFKKL